MNWTDERVEMLKKLWDDGLSASQIAVQLGGISRNAIIGKVHRLKLSGRGRTASAPKKVSRKPDVREATSSTIRPRDRPERFVSVQRSAEPTASRDLMPTRNVEVPVSRQLRLVELSESACKWPNGSPLDEDFSFCGNDSGNSGPYCTYHSRLAYQPAGERRRLR